MTCFDIKYELLKDSKNRFFKQGYKLVDQRKKEC